MFTQPNYLFSIVIVAIIWCLPSQSDAQHLHAVIVVDSHDSSIGNSVLTDGQNMIDWIQGGLSSNRYTIHVVEGADAEPDSILRKLQNLRVTERDSVLFYYSGHGAFDNKTSSHYFQFSQSRDVLHRSDVKNTISIQSPRLSVIISDCCASILAQNQSDPGVKEAVAGMGVTPLFQELFFNTRGIVDITSSRPGQFSIGDRDGGVFTNAFLSVANDLRYEKSNWNDVFTQTRRRASASFERKDSSKTLRNEGFADDQFTQTAWSFEPMYSTNPNDGRLGISIDRNSPGLISFVQPDSAAQIIGLEIGDRITSVNGLKNLSTDQMVDRILNSSRDLELMVVCQSTGNHYRLFAKLPF